LNLFFVKGKDDGIIKTSERPINQMIEITWSSLENGPRLKAPGIKCSLPSRVSLIQSGITRMANKEGISTRIVEKITITMAKITIAKVGADAGETGDPFECLCVSPEEGKYTTHACSSDQP